MDIPVHLFDKQHADIIIFALQTIGFLLGVIITIILWVGQRFVKRLDKLIQHVDQYEENVTRTLAIHDTEIQFLKKNLTNKCNTG